MKKNIFIYPTLQLKRVLCDTAKHDKEIHSAWSEKNKCLIRTTTPNHSPSPTSNPKPTNTGG